MSKRSIGRNFPSIQMVLAIMLTASGIQGQTQPGPAIRPLSPNQPIEREMKGDEAHSYSVALTSGQYLYVIVDQRGIDVVVTVFGPDGKKLLEVDSPNYWRGPEPVSMIAETTGDYRLEVRSLEKTAVPGRYEARIVELRGATEQDKSRVDVERLLTQAQMLEAEGTAQSLQSAIKKYEESLPLLRAVGDRYRETLTIYYIGRIAHDIGEQQKALDCFLQILPFIRAIGYSFGEAQVLHGLGEVYSSLGEKRKALEYYTQALPLSRASGDRNGQAATFDSIGRVYSSLGEKQRALDYYAQALPLLRAVGDRTNEAHTLNNIGAVYYSLGEKQKALDYYGQSLPLSRGVGDRRSEAATLTNIGSVYDSSREKQKALDYYAQALPLSRAVGDGRGEATALNKLMYYYESLGNPRFAVFYGKLSVNAYQQLRSNIRGIDIDIQRTYLKSVELTYRDLSDLLITQGRSAEAQQVLNAFKDQQFFDFDQTQARQLEPLARTPRETEFAVGYEKATSNLATIGTKVDEFKRRVGPREPNAEEVQRLQELEGQLKTAADESSALLKQGEAEFSQPTDERDNLREVRDTGELQATLRKLSQETGHKTVAVYALLGQSHYYALLVTPDGVTSFSSVVKGSELDAKALQLWALLQSADYDPTVLSKELYNIVFKPLEDKLPKDTRTIMWSLDGNLRYLPMAALYDGKQHLVERFNHVVFTRSDRERLTRAVSATWTGYGFATSGPHRVESFGNPITFGPLDFVKNEMQIFRTKTYSDGIIEGDIFHEAQFTKSALLSTLKQRRPLVHISSHFAFRPGDSSRSFLLLGDGKIMTLAEMKGQVNLLQGVELLTLSACDTAAQLPDATGREIDTFAELAQRLGAGGVLASLWAVSDSSTAQLMKRFYKNRQHGKYNKSEALRRAQLDLLYGRNEAAPFPSVTTSVALASTKGNITSDEEVFVEAKYRIPFKVDKKRPFAHPYYWSPFILFGNWR